MRWEHVNLDEAIWTIPRTKNGVEHKVPLSAAAVDVLYALGKHKPGGLVFPSPDRPGKSLSNGAMLALLDRMGSAYADLTVHGFRATFKTWASERTNFARDVVEAALAHAISDKLEAAYRRGDFFDKRRRLMDAWAKYCSAPVSTKSKIVAFGR